jgi:lysophospholipase L1-like esterase
MTKAAVEQGEVRTDASDLSGEPNLQCPSRTKGRSLTGITGKRRLIRITFAAYVLAVSIIAWLSVFSPGAMDRVKRFVFRTPQYRPDYQGTVTGQATVTQSMANGSAVFLGDSRMRDVDVSQVAAQPVLNLSIGGDTTAGLLYRIPRYSHLEKSRLVVVAVGINDLSHFSDEEILKNYETILTYLTKLGIKKIVVVCLIPVETELYRQSNSALLRGNRTTNERIQTFNEKLRLCCSHFSEVKVIDVNEYMVNSQGGLRTDFTEDGLHFNDDGIRACTRGLHEQLHDME